MLAAVTAVPDCDHVAFQPWLTFWLPGNANFSVHPDTASPTLVILTDPVNPPPPQLDVE